MPWANSNASGKRRSEALAFLVHALTQKKVQIFESSTLGTHPPDLSVETVEKMNRVVQTHNARCGEFEAQVVTARNGLAFDMEAESSEEYKSLANNVVKSQLATTYASEEVKRIERGDCTARTRNRRAP